jgi:hypothetical protein
MSDRVGIAGRMLDDRAQRLQVGYQMITLEDRPGQGRQVFQRRRRIEQLVIAHQPELIIVIAAKSHVTALRLDKGGATIDAQGLSGHEA